MLVSHKRRMIYTYMSFSISVGIVFFSSYFFSKHHATSKQAYSYRKAGNAVWSFQLCSAPKANNITTRRRSSTLHSYSLCILMAGT
ncbi:hypothetical protein RIF29_16741 [Crotalaria pallida]|uniref:Uncharacterized protein n=1 Tax=Crotalaria pallida TaxID=3830 RepID=A0AAN9IK17_CROPI